MSRLLPFNNRDWTVIMEENDPNFFKSKAKTRSRSRSRSRSATQEAKNYGDGIVEYKVAPRCSRGATCSRNACEKFHGPKECNFHAGKMIDKRERLPGGKRNPQKGKSIPCDKGARCTFNHRSQTRRKKTEDKLYETARKAQAPVLYSEADLFAAYPNLEYRAADDYSLGRMTSLDQECLMLSLKKSGVEYEMHRDFITIKI
jgi:hypothetical protein